MRECHRLLSIDWHEDVWGSVYLSGSDLLEQAKQLRGAVIATAAEWARDQANMMPWTHCA